MNVVIVNPITDNKEIDLYMAVLYLGTALHRNGHKVTVLDSQVEERIEGKIRRLVSKTDCFCFTVMTTQIKHALKLSRMIKDVDSKVTVVWGGVHPTIQPIQTIKEEVIDYVVRGEGEHTLLELLDFKKGKGKLKDIKGLVYLEKGKVRINPERPFIDLNEFSPPEWKLLKMERYVKEFSIDKLNFGTCLPVHSGRGCPYNCAFCINTVLSTRKWRALSAENVINEIKLLKEKFKIQHVKFVDENFFLDKNRVKDICNKMLEEGLDIKWHGLSRANYFNKNHINNELLHLAKKAGCRVISMGIESGSPRMLKFIRKGITVDDAVNSAWMCKKFGIIPIYSFMTGLPMEKKEDMIMTLSLIKRLKKIHPEAMIIGPQIFRPYPGCELYDLVKKDFNEPKTLSGWMKMDLAGGYNDATALPWVKNPDFVNNVGFYIGRLESEPSSIPRKILEMPFKMSAKLRLNHTFFSFPIERKLFGLGQNLYYSFKKK